MKHSTFSAQVANNLLTLLQGYSKTIRLLLVMFLTLTVTTNAWGATITINGSASGITTTDGNQTITVDGITFKGKFKQYSTTALWFTSGSGYIYNTTSLGTINSITINYKSGGSASSKQYFTSGNSAITSYQSGTPQITTSTGGNSGTHSSFSGGFFNISISNKNLQATSIVIDYTPAGGGGSTPTQLAAPTGLNVTNITSTSATLSWDEVANASSYLVTIVDAGDLSADIPNTQTSHTFEGLTPSTEYLWTVTAVGDGINYTNSEESETGEFTTSAAGGGGGEGECSWKETAIGNIEDDDIVVITMTTSGGTTYAMSNDNGTSAPAATTVTVSGSTLTGDIEDNLKWNITNNAGSLTIYPNGTTSTWLYCTNSNNGVKVGTGTANEFTINDGYLYTSQTTDARYVGVYTTNPDWRCYTSTTGNIANQTLKFYVYKCDGGGGDEPTPTQLTKPTNLKVSDVTTTTATLSWDAVANANGYTVVVGSTSHNTNTTSITVEDLTASTTYKWSVTAKGNGSTYTDSDAANGSDFTTATPAPTNYTVTLNPNYPAGKTGTFKDKEEHTVNGNLEISLPANTESQTIASLYSSISLEGYIFEGWYEAADGNSKRTNTGDITKDITFYAHWKVPYTVTFNAGTGNCATESITETTANGITLPTATFTDCGDWTFLGWAETAIESETTTAPASFLAGGSTYKPTSDITLYAIYKRVEGGGGGEGTEATLTFDNTSKRTAFTTTQQVWTENGITLTNNKASSTSNVADFSNPARFYAKSEIIISAPANINKIVANCNKGASDLVSSVGAEASNSNNAVTIIPTSSNTTFTIAQLSAQVQMSSITVTYGGGLSTSYYYSNPVCGSTPTLTVNPTSLAFGNVTVNSNKEMTFTLTGSDLTANAALALSGTNESMFSVNPTSVTQSAGSIDQTITVTYAPTAAGNHTATLTISSTDAESKTVTLSGVGSNPPTWRPATINFEGIIQVACGSTTVLNPADPNNGPATITFNGYDLQNSVTVTASEGFLVSINRTNDAAYSDIVTVNPVASGENQGKITQNVYVIAQAPAQSGNYDGTITLTGADITNGSQVINVTAAVTCTQYTITWSVSGDTEMIEPTTFYAGGEWTLPEDPTFDCNGRVFVGWTNNEIVQPQDIAPNVLYKEQGDFPTIESDITFYAVFAQEGTGDGSGTATVTDVLNRETTGATNTTYITWSDKQDNSSAVYAGHSAGGNESIQLRTNNNNSGIITTTSGGKARKVTVVWNTNTTSGRELDIYGKNSTYSAVTDLYGNNAGTLIGSITYNTSTTLTISDDYEYIGIRSSSGALYLTSISIQWETDGEGDGNATTYTSYTTSCADVKAIRIVEPTTKTFNEGDKFVFDGEVWAINSDDTETNVTNSPLVHFVYDMNKVGTQTVTVSYLGFTATYEITIKAVEKWQITWNVSGATNTGLSPATVVKGQTIGKLPNPKAIPDGCEGKTFVGWTESNTVNSDGTEITFITSSTVPTQNTTYYAVFATPSGNAGDGDYVKVTEDANDLSGEYLIVYEDSEGSPAAPKAFNGGLTTLDAVGNTIAVTISNNTIASTPTTDAAKFTIAKDGEGDYTIKSASGKYIGRTADANELDENESTPYKNTITFTDGNANIIGSGGAYLRYNNTSNQLRFRYYKSDTYTNQKSIALYKKSGSSASYTDYTTGCQDVTITYYGFTGGYTTNCGGSDLNVIAQRVNSEHTIPNCGNITDPTNLGRTFLNLWKDQNGKEHKPGDSFIVTENITLYAQWALNTSENTTLPTDVDDLATTDIVVNGGHTLTLQAGTTTINSLTLKGGLLGANSESGYAMPSVVIPDNATLVRKNTTINLDLVVNSDSWYPFAVPFAVANNNNIDYLDPVLKAASTYNTHFAIKTYDGENRAKVGTNQEANWDKVLQTAGLQPGKGYIISALTYPDKDTATIRIPMTVPNEWLTNGEQTTVNEVTRNQVTVTAYTGDAATEHQRHAGWNFVANPYLANFAGTNASGSFINGEIIINKGDYDYGGEDVPYVTIPTYNFAHYYQVKLSEATLSPAYSFFVQVGTDGTMTFDVAGRQAAPASIAARNAEERPVKMDVDITLSDNHSSDQTGIIISDRYSEAYEIGRDLEKLFGSAYNLSVYTLMADNTPLAFQALAIRSSMQVIPVGYRAPEQGEYTFRLNEATSSIDLLNEQYEQLVLVDYQTGELTNLLIADYTFYSERTQADNRFAIYAVPRQNAPTDLPNAIGQDKQAQKILHNGHLYILRDGNVYNGNGQIVK